jgi:hypothetical protein
VGVSGSGGVLSEVLVLFFFSYRNPASHENHQQKRGAFGRTVVMHAVAPIRLLGALVG